MHLWGSDGGDDAAPGGNGGYATGMLHINARQNIYVYVGRRGESGTGYNPSYNGGGNSGGGHGWSGSGGGATDVRTASGAWNQNLWSRLLVAGAGGGGGCATAGGVGGGTVGGTSAGGIRGGTQTSAGPGGSFGIGGTNRMDGGGGGGGWYGGGADQSGDRHRGDLGGGGGSSYIGGSAANPVRNGKTIAGNSWMPNTSLNGQMVGNNGPCFCYFYLTERD